MNHTFAISSGAADVWPTWQRLKWFLHLNRTTCWHESLSHNITVSWSEQWRGRWPVNPFREGVCISQVGQLMFHFISWSLMFYGGSHVAYVSKPLFFLFELCLRVVLSLWQFWRAILLFNGPVSRLAWRPFNLRLEDLLQWGSSLPKSDRLGSASYDIVIFVRGCDWLLLWPIFHLSIRASNGGDCFTSYEPCSRRHKPACCQKFPGQSIGRCIDVQEIH